MKCLMNESDILGGDIITEGVMSRYESKTDKD